VISLESALCTQCLNFMRKLWKTIREFSYDDLDFETSKSPELASMKVRDQIRDTGLKDLQNVISSL
jgi:hypothetical protein